MSRHAPSLLALALTTSLLGCNEYNLAGERKPDAVEQEPEPPVEPAPDIVVEPMILDFGFQAIDCPSQVHKVTVRNEGDELLEIFDIQLAGLDLASFRLMSEIVALAPGQEEVFRVNFTADADRVHDAFVMVTSNDPDTPRVDVGLLGEGADFAMVEQAFQQGDADRPVDILWVVDNSGSMDGEVNNLANSFDSFINQFVTFGLDYQIGVVTTDMYDPAQSGQLQGPTRVITSASPDPVADFKAATDAGSNGSGSEQGFDAAVAALTDPLISGFNAGMIRADATLSVIVVTDEDDDSDMNGADFASWLDAYKADPADSAFHAISGPKGGLFPCIAFFSGISAEPAPQYGRAVTDTGGTHSSICMMNMDAILTELGSAVAGIKTEFVVNEPIIDLSLVEITVEGRPIQYSDVDGVTYDPVTQTLTFHGSAIPAPGESVLVVYPVEPEC